MYFLYIGLIVVTILWWYDNVVSKCKVFPCSYTATWMTGNFQRWVFPIKKKKFKLHQSNFYSRICSWHPNQGRVHNKIKRESTSRWPWHTGETRKCKCWQVYADAFIIVTEDRNYDIWAHNYKIFSHNYEIRCLVLFLIWDCNTLP